MEEEMRKTRFPRTAAAAFRGCLRRNFVPDFFFFWVNFILFFCFVLLHFMDWTLPGSLRRHSAGDTRRFRIFFVHFCFFFHRVFISDFAVSRFSFSFLFVCFFWRIWFRPSSHSFVWVETIWQNEWIMKTIPFWMDGNLFFSPTTTTNEMNEWTNEWKCLRSGRLGFLQWFSQFRNSGIKQNRKKTKHDRWWGKQNKRRATSDDESRRPERTAIRGANRESNQTSREMGKKQNKLN